MKRTTILIALAFSVTSSYAANRIPTAAEYTNAWNVVKAYRKAYVKRTGVTKTVLKNKDTKAKSTDHTLAQLQKIAKEQRNRFEVIKKTVNRYDPAKTNLFARPARASMQVKLDTARSKASEYWTGYTNQIAQTQVYSNAVVVAQGIANAAQAKIRNEIAELNAEKTDLEEKIADSKYILLRTWLKTKLAAVETRIKTLESLANAES